MFCPSEVLQSFKLPMVSLYTGAFVHAPSFC